MTDLFRNTLSPLQWGILAAVPLAILALYFLKLKRLPLEVPSTYLWRKTIEDLHVNSLWQKLRKSLLLFLQLLIVALAIFALLRPGWEGTKLEGQRFIFLIDNSASMSARDVVDASSRLDSAKRQVASLIDQMDSGMTAMIVSFADGPRVVQEFTDDTRLLRERLATIEPTYRGTDLREALKLAASLANSGSGPASDEKADSPDEISAGETVTAYLFSDGRFEDIKELRLGKLEPIYVPVGSQDAPNIAVTAFSTRRSESRPEERQAFAQVTNFGEETAKVTVEVLLNGEFLDAKELEILPDASVGATFPLADAPAGALEVRLSGPGIQDDVLPSDNRGYAALNDTPPGRVLVVTPGNVALEVALDTDRARRLATIEFAEPSVLKEKSHQQLAESGAYSLIVYDQCAPPAMPRANTLFVGSLPPLATWRPATTDVPPDSTTPSEPPIVTEPQIIDWNRAHPLLANVELGTVAILSGKVLTLPPGGTALIDSTDGTVFAVAPRESFEDAVLGFAIVSATENGQAINTNWPRRHSFPTFWLNVLEYFVGQADDLASPNSVPGRPVQLRTLAVAQQATVVAPDGKRHDLRRQTLEPFQFHQTDQPGVYEVIEQNQVTNRFAVNLFDRQESDVQLQSEQLPDGSSGVRDLQIGATVISAENRTPARQETWRYLLLAALLILLLEWYIYNRRVYV